MILFPPPLPLTFVMAYCVARILGEKGLLPTFAGQEETEEASEEDTPECNTLRDSDQNFLKAIGFVSQADARQMNARFLDTLYLNQIAAAQEYLDENQHADLARVQRLLQKMMPPRYYPAIARLKEYRPQVIVYQIYGGQHVHAPNAQKVIQKNRKKSDK